MKNLVLSILLIFSANSMAQNLVNLDTVILVDNTDSKTIYDRIHSLLTNRIKSQKQKEYLFKTEDKEGGIIKVSGNFPNETKVFNGSGLTSQDVSYEYQAFFKDGRMRLIVESFNHPYFGPAIDVSPYPEGSIPKMTSKKWYAKVYDEFLSNVKSVRKNILSNTLQALESKNVMEEDW